MIQKEKERINKEKDDDKAIDFRYEDRNGITNELILGFLLKTFTLVIASLNACMLIGMSFFIITDTYIDYLEKTSHNDFDDYENDRFRNSLP